MTTADWPFGTDADRDDPLTALRIPVTNTYCRWVYLAGFDRESEARPTDAEALVLASFVDYQRDWFNETWQARMLAQPLDVEGGHNTTIFHKWAAGDWGYSKRTWTMGPHIWPGPPSYRTVGPLALVGLMDHIYDWGDGGISPRWLAWKAAHPEVFPAGEEQPDA